MKVSELAGALLDYWVAKAEGHDVRRCDDGMYWSDTACSPVGVTALTFPEETYYSPSTLWDQGGPIIERDRIAIWGSDDGEWTSTYPGEPGYGGNDYYIDVSDGVRGPTALVSAMRARIVAKLGREVPDDPSASFEAKP